MFSIDGMQWAIPCDISRTAEVTPSDISGLMLDKSYFNDVIGTFMKYTISIAVPVSMRDEYARIYEALTDPVDGHAFVLPYNNSTITITARVTSISDVYVRLPNNGDYWKRIQFEIIANHPSKAKTLDQVIAMGRTPLPDIAAPAEGDTYTWHDGQWGAAATYTDADGVYY